MFLLYSLSLGAPIWPIGVGGPRVRPVRTHSSYATGIPFNMVVIYTRHTSQFGKTIVHDIFLLYTCSYVY
jgi:hypothetical protein